MSIDARVCIGGEGVAGGPGAYNILNPPPPGGGGRAPPGPAAQADAAAEPAPEEVVGRAPQGSVEQSIAATEAAAEAFESWSRTSPEERANLLEKAADLYDQRKDEFAPLVQAETGATMRVAKTMQVPQVSA